MHVVQIHEFSPGAKFNTTHYTGGFLFKTYHPKLLKRYLDLTCFLKTYQVFKKIATAGISAVAENLNPIRYYKT
jgi:hypothetical protein